MNSLVRRIAFGVKEAGTALVCMAVVPLSPELAIAWASRSKEPIMPRAKLGACAADASAHAALRAMQHFHDTPRTEEAFYLRCTFLPRQAVLALQRYYGTSEHWALFHEICAFWEVGRRRGKRATQRLHEYEQALPLFALRA